MKPKKVENELQNLKNIHLTDSEIAAYCDQDLDSMRRARMEAHLKQCFICEQEVTQWKEESEALRNRKIPADDVAFVKRLREQRGLERQPFARKSEKSVKKAPRSKRLAGYIQQLNENWQSYFMQLKPVRGTTPTGAEIWRGETKDGVLVAYATLEETADLTIHICSTDQRLEGSRLRVRAGSLTRETTLQGDPQSSEVSGEIKIPRNKRPRKLTDISIEEVR